MTAVSVAGWSLVVALAVLAAAASLWRWLVGGTAKLTGALAELPVRLYPAHSAHASPRPGAGDKPLVVFLTSDAGWPGLNTSLPRALAERGYPTVSWNSLRYYTRRRSPQEASEHLAALVDEFCARWSRREVALVGYSWGAGVLPFLARRLPPVQRRKLRAAVYLAYPGFGAFHFKPSAWWLEIGDEAIPAREEVAAMPDIPSVCIAGEGDPIRDCRSIESLGVRRELFPAGHSLTKILDDLLPFIVGTLEAANGRADKPRDL